MTQLSERDKGIVCGFYLSKWDRVGLDRLSFKTFKEAYNVLGYALGIAPNSIKAYRDEIDPYVSDKRIGRKNREMRQYIERIYDEYKGHELDEIASMIAKFTGVDFAEPPSGENQSSFAKRLLTGVAAENFFLENYNKHMSFRSGSVRDMTKIGCGYDFSVHPSAGGEILAVEVKGVGQKQGGILMTEKEYDVATSMAERYFLYVVVGMDMVPSAVVYKNPVTSSLSFRRMERSVSQISWQTRI
jgi:hypothetical protein